MSTLQLHRPKDNDHDDDEGDDVGVPAYDVVMLMMMVTMVMMKMMGKRGCPTQADLCLEKEVSPTFQPF